MLPDVSLNAPILRNLKALQLGLTHIKKVTAVWLQGTGELIEEKKIVVQEAKQSQMKWNQTFGNEGFKLLVHLHSYIF